MKLVLVRKLKEFLNAAEYRYDIGMNRMVPKPSLSPLEFIDWEVISGLFKMDLFNSFRSYTEKYFSHPYLKSIVEFPTLSRSDSRKYSCFI